MTGRDANCTHPFFLSKKIGARLKIYFINLCHKMKKYKKDINNHPSCFGVKYQLFIE